MGGSARAHVSCKSESLRSRIAGTATNPNTPFRAPGSRRAFIVQGGNLGFENLVHRQRHSQVAGELVDELSAVVAGAVLMAVLKLRQVLVRVANATGDVPLP